MTACTESPPSLIGGSAQGPQEACEELIRLAQSSGWSVSAKSELVEHTVEASLSRPVENGSELLSMTCTDVSGTTTATLSIAALLNRRPGN